MQQINLSDRTAIVTGGASGIGLATVEALAGLGVTVALNHLPDDPEGEQRLSEMRDKGLSVIAAPGDVSNAGEAEAMITGAIQNLGRLDYLINNAGTPNTRQPVPESELDRLDEDFWHAILHTNLIGPYRCTRAAAPALRETGGAIVNTASVAGLGRQGSSSAYCASKAGLINLTRSLARGLGPDIRVNAVAPGSVNSPWQKDWPEAVKQDAAEKAVLKRQCVPDDIAEVIVFLCISGRMVTGQTIVVDGGLTL